MASRVWASIAVLVAAGVFALFGAVMLTTLKDSAAEVAQGTSRNSPSQDVSSFLLGSGVYLITLAIVGPLAWFTGRAEWLIPHGIVLLMFLLRVSAALDREP